MNDARQLLSNLALDLHGPAIELLQAMEVRRIRVQLQVPKSGTPKNRAQSCSFAVLGATITVEEPSSAMETTLSDIVARYNEKRKRKLKANGNGLSFAPKPKEKA